MNLGGNSEGGLDIHGVVGAGLETKLNKLSSDCSGASDLSIEYYATDLPDKNPTNLQDLLTLIQEFPSRLKDINQGHGVPIKVIIIIIIIEGLVLTALNVPASFNVKCISAEYLLTKKIHKYASLALFQRPGVYSYLIRSPTANFTS